MHPRQEKIKKTRKDPAHIKRIQRHQEHLEQQIANVFGELYSKLHADDQREETELEIDKNETENDKGDQSAGEEETKEIPEFTIRGVAGCH